MSETDRTVVWLDGRLQDPSSAAVSWSDHGLTVGDGVFETIELRSGNPFALTRHLTRLAASSTGLGLQQPDDASVRSAVEQVCDAWGDTPGRLRITYTAGAGPMGSGRGEDSPTLIVAASSMVIQRDPTSVILVPYRRNERGALTGLKTTSYAENVVALAAASAAGASEALFANTVDLLCEGTGSNVFLVLDGRLITPPLDSGCLAGVTRQLLMEGLARNGQPATEEHLHVDRLDDVEEMFLVSTGRHVQPVVSVASSPIGDGVGPGPLTVQASSIWDSEFADSVDP